MPSCERDIRQHLRWDTLAGKVLDGGAISRTEALSILAAEDLEIPALLAAAFRLRTCYFGRQVQLYYLKNAKSGICPEDCHYCSQSKISTAQISKYAMSSRATILEGAKQAVQAQAKTYCIVASGRSPNQREVEHVARTVREIKETYPLHICVCLGLLQPEDVKALKQAGVDRINHNLNTSRRFHPQICTTHTFDDRLATLRAAKDAGLELCCGCIIGMGEEEDDVVDVALTLRDLEVDSIPINFLHSIEGTPLQDVSRLDPRYCLKALCLFRFVHPSTEIRIAGGRELHLRSLQSQALYAANSIFVSDYLTTAGQAASEDFRMIEDLGFQIVLPNGELAGEHAPTAAAR